MYSQSADSLLSYVRFFKYKKLLWQPQNYQIKIGIYVNFVMFIDLASFEKLPTAVNLEIEKNHAHYSVTNETSYKDHTTYNYNPLSSRLHKQTLKSGYVVHARKRFCVGSNMLTVYCIYTCCIFRSQSHSCKWTRARVGELRPVLSLLRIQIRAAVFKPYCNRNNKQIK